MSNLVKVVLHGALAEQLGRAEWAFDVKSPTEALQAIEANTGKLVSSLLSNWATEYHVLVNGKPVKSVEEMSIMERPDLKTVEFLPVFRGRGDGSGWLILIGILLIVLVIAAPYLGVGVGLSASSAGTSAAVASGSAVAVGTTGALVGTLVFGMGLSLVFSGVAAMLAPSDSSDQLERPENRPSYIFNGAVNTYRQGNPVPVGYGRLVIGSQVISAGLRAIDIDART